MEDRIYHKAVWLNETEPQTLRSGLEEKLVSAGFKVLGFMEHHFKPEGYTALWLLAESHLALHTFPEKGSAYVELSSCNAEKLNVFFSRFAALHEERNLA